MARQIKKKSARSRAGPSERRIRALPRDEPTRREPSVAELRANLGLSRALFSRMVGASERSVASWETGRGPSSRAALQAVGHARRIYETASRVMKPAYVGTWLVTPLDVFGGLKPLEVIERGEYDRVWKELHIWESGTYA